MKFRTLAARITGTFAAIAIVATAALAAVPAVAAEPSADPELAQIREQLNSSPPLRITVNAKSTSLDLSPFKGTYPECLTRSPDPCLPSTAADRITAGTLASHSRALQKDSLWDIRSPSADSADVQIRPAGTDLCLQELDGQQVGIGVCLLEDRTSQWYLVPTSSGGFRIHNANSDRCVSFATPKRNFAVQFGQYVKTVDCATAPVEDTEVQLDGRGYGGITLLHDGTEAIVADPIGANSQLMSIDGASKYDIRSKEFTPSDVVVSPDGNTAFFVAPLDKKVASVDLAGGGGAKTLPNMPAPTAIAMSPDGTRLFIASSEKGRSGFIVLPGDTLKTLSVYVGGAAAPPVNSDEIAAATFDGVAFSPDSAMGFLISRSANTLVGFNAGSGEVEFKAQLPSTPDDVVVGDSFVAVSSLAAKTIQLFDRATLQPLSNGTITAGGFTNMVVSRDSAYIYAVDPVNKQVARIDVAGRKVLGPALKLDGTPFDLALRPDGSRLYVTFADHNQMGVISTGIPATGSEPVLSTLPSVSIEPPLDQGVFRLLAANHAITKCLKAGDLENCKVHHTTVTDGYGPAECLYPAYNSGSGVSGYGNVAHSVGKTDATRDANNTTEQNAHTVGPHGKLEVAGFRGREWLKAFIELEYKYYHSNTTETIDEESHSKTTVDTQTIGNPIPPPGQFAWMERSPAQLTFEKNWILFNPGTPEEFRYDLPDFSIVDYSRPPLSNAGSDPLPPEGNSCFSPAQVKIIANPYIITYNANGGTGFAPVRQVYNSIWGATHEGSELQISFGPNLEKAGSHLESWNTQPDGSGTRYDPGTSVKPSEDVTLYAQWAVGPQSAEAAAGAEAEAAANTGPKRFLTAPSSDQAAAVVAAPNPGAARIDANGSVTNLPGSMGSTSTGPEVVANGGAGRERTPLSKADETRDEYHGDRVNGGAGGGGQNPAAPPQ